MNLLSFFGLDAQIQKLRVAVGEGAVAMEDRFQLARLEWEEEKQRLKLLLGLALVLLGLTVVALTIASLAFVVQFWDSPDRAFAAWSVATVWLVLWGGVALGMVSLLRRGVSAFGPTRAELAKDWASLKADITAEPRKARHPPREPAAPVDKQVLLDRIAEQRARIARLRALPVASAVSATSTAPAGSASAARRAPAPAPAASAWITTADPAFPRSATMRVVRDHPVTSIAVVGGAAAVVTALGPRRVARMASWVLPLLLPRR